MFDFIVKTSTQSRASKHRKLSSFLIFPTVHLSIFLYIFRFLFYYIYTSLSNSCIFLPSIFFEREIMIQDSAEKENTVKAERWRVKLPPQIITQPRREKKKTLFIKKQCASRWVPPHSTHQISPTTSPHPTPPPKPHEPREWIINKPSQTPSISRAPLLSFISFRAWCCGDPCVRAWPMLCFRPPPGPRPIGLATLPGSASDWPAHFSPYPVGLARSGFDYWTRASSIWWCGWAGFGPRAELWIWALLGPMDLGPMDLLGVDKLLRSRLARDHALRSDSYVPIGRWWGSAGV